MVEPLLERLEHNVYNAFPMPKFHVETQSAAAQQQPSSFSQEPNSVPPSSNQENTPPTETENPSQSTIPGSAATPSPSDERVPDSKPQSVVDSPADTLPPPLVLLLDSIKSTLKTFFASKPPHTIQRLAELVLRPNAHYRTLPAYLRAVDRVVSVTSTADIFPLQTEPSAGQVNGVLNGGGHGFMFPDHAPGSDESLGGALLTPIPWLTGASSPDNDGGATLSEGLVPGDSLSLATQTSQPEQVQQQAQDPIAQTQSSEMTAQNETMGGARPPPVDSSEEIPHARGPPIVGVEDMGLQDGKGVEMTLAQDANAPADQSSAPTDQPRSTADEQTENQKPASRANADSDGDIQLDDVKEAGESAPAATATGAAAEAEVNETLQTTENKDF
ncbi:hypothetical protein LV164_000275 [Aspergillus fumigatus]|nr:hypothetical protein KXX42_005466 [Aspergillus fumigatus]KAH2169911.1 hypothetical protein KXV74_001130 [Aspergillus fumigatus]KAH2307587.1 hypothetical protein KXV47_006935 [Aspergillus fumigatus]KAH2764564.1 hypothetical protein KXV94_005113 [Aspergillus fumigatus]KAH3148263.1 hypothetical protein KXW18_002942 [Aspergillus fumigatus]